MSDPKLDKTVIPSKDITTKKAAIGDLTVTYLSNGDSPDAGENSSADHERPPASEHSPQQDSRFRIVRPHAKGGLGEVSVATDTELNREVALKEIQARFASDIPNRLRFVLEAEVTGALEHPGIVPVYGLGQHQDGRPYYAMRFVRGDSLKEAVDRFHLSGGVTAEPREFRSLLGRLVDVCNAIEYAHARGVLHRDLKPGNVMLGQYGETLVVDWGLAKVIGRDDLEFEKPEHPEAPVAVTSGDASQTMDGSTIGTPAYMSPEQAAGDLKNLGPPADVYSLGATLFYLLTGTSPAEGDSLADLLANVQSGNIRVARTVNTSVPAALSSIAAKALALRPADRYQSPKSLAEDIQRWLDDEPVLAHRDPPLVRLRRWARRHPKSVTAASAALLLGLGCAAAIAAVVSGKNAELADANTQLEEAYEAQRQATTAMDEARAKADEQRKIAVAKAAEAKAVLEFFEETVLTAARPKGQDGGMGIDVTVRAAIDNAASILGDSFEKQPSVEATIHQSLGKTYGLLGEYKLAETEIAAAVTLMKNIGPETELLSAKTELMEYTRLTGRAEETVEPLQKIYARQIELLGKNDSETLETASNLASSYAELGRHEKALAIFEPTLEVIRKIDGYDTQRAMSAANNMVMPLLAVGRTDQARTILEELVQESTEAFGPNHPDTLTYLGNLASVLVSTQDHDRAVEIIERALEANTELRGPTHPATLATRANRASIIVRKGQHSEALSEMKEVARLAQETLGKDHSATMKYDANLAGIYMHMELADDAVPIYASLLERQEKQLGRLDDTYLMTQVSSGMALAASGKTEQAKETYTSAIESYTELYGKDSEYVTALQAMLSNLEPAATEPK